MNLIPERLPSGRRIRSFITNESDDLRVRERNRWTRDIAKHAAMHTRMEVLRPSGAPVLASVQSK